ncbi:hypothetical protein [Chryseobacterium sp. ERMR1:04]|uniref:hypothetical protein n=1 Tax=Chryseobacterium sp. ERMR1:04 TaxID=1705393 RepID=UPI0006CDEC9A|nr:hypothetical protein [Chryseobacterium sp. ERMR1:04]KPH14531.1 hypothetical protein AMQ68_03370 [Chryseobacterium sp. ERMR1:04]
MMRQTLMTQNQQMIRSNQKLSLMNNSNGMFSIEKDLEVSKKQVGRMDERIRKVEEEIISQQLDLDKTENKEKLQKEIERNQTRSRRLQKDKQTMQKRIDLLESQIAKTQKK